MNKKTILPLEKAPVISQTLNVVAKPLTLSLWNKGDHSENTSPVWFGHLLLRPSPGKLNSSLSFFFFSGKKHPLSAGKGFTEVKISRPGT